MKITLEKILLDYINTQEGWITKGQLGLISEREGYLPESCGRHLRKLAEKKEILRSYYKGKRGQKLVRYAKLDTKPEPKPSIIIRDGIAYLL